MNKSEIIARLLEPGVIAVIRADNSDQLLDAAAALIEGGVSAIEVTMTTPNAIEVIRATAKRFGDNVLLGVGTVLDSPTAIRAMEAGAEYVVTPVVRLEVIATCLQREKPIFSGAYTPTEAFTAWEAGSDFIKIFPAEGLGASYIKSVRAPLPQLKMVPSGGVTAENCGEFIQAGCVAISAGSSLVRKAFLQNRDWKGLKEKAEAFVVGVKNARAQMRC